MRAPAQCGGDAGARCNYRLTCSAQHQSKFFFNALSAAANIVQAVVPGVCDTKLRCKTRPPPDTNNCCNVCSDSLGIPASRCASVLVVSRAQRSLTSVRLTASAFGADKHTERSGNTPAAADPDPQLDEPQVWSPINPRAFLHARARVQCAPLTAAR